MRDLLAPVRRLRAWFSTRPVRALALAAAAAAVISSYPVVFFGKSFVAPNFGARLLYDGFPTLPGYAEKQVPRFMGSDFGAVMWHHLPLSILERRALFHDHELPLWDRYNATGVVLLGQSQSMFGDPLHLLLPVLFGPAAWDLKYLAAKWLLAFGLGLVVWAAARHLPAALIVAFAADFVGFFIYRVNHPAFFSFCYAPWIIYCWARAVQTDSWRRAVPWALGLTLANWAEITSGTAKEAYMLLLSMNFTGAMILLTSGQSWGRRLRRLGLMLWAGLIFALISAPIWLVFLDALKSSFTLYGEPRAYQIPPSLLLGLFDELFYRPFMPGEWVSNPSANFVFLLGLIAFLVYLRATLANRMARGIMLGLLPPLALAFGLIPPLWIARMPFLGNILHLDDVFSCALVVQIAVLAGIGFAAAAGRLGRPEGAFDLGLGLALLAALFFPYLAALHVVPRLDYGRLAWGQTVALSPFVAGSLVALPIAAAMLALLCRLMLRTGSASPLRLVLAAGCTFVLLWRFGLQRHAPFGDYTTNPPDRVDLLAASPAIEAVRADRGPPFRVLGLESNLAPGWTAVYGLEGINGPDALINGYYRQLQDAFGFERIWGWRLLAHASTLAALQPYDDFLGVKYVFALPGDRPTMPRRLAPVLQADLDVYRSATPWPRAFFADRIVRYHSAAELAALIRARAPAPFAALQDDEPAPPSASPDRPAPGRIVPARDYRLNTNRTAFTIDAPGPGVIVLQEAFIPEDFQATIDGKPAAYFRINHAFKGVAIDRAGRYRVAFAYWPRSMNLALGMAAAGAAGLIGTAWSARRRPAPPA